MGKKNNAELIAEIERIKRRVKASDPRWNEFVCTAAGRGPYGDTIRRMVRRHIHGYSTMNCFLSVQKGVRQPFEPKVGNKYRLLMLDNMIEWVKKGNYK
jgi:hypothetical protein